MTEYCIVKYSNNITWKKMRKNNMLLFVFFCICDIPKWMEASMVKPKTDYETHMMLKGMLKDYDPKLKPNYSGAAVEVVVDATILSISNIDEVRMIYTLDMFFRQRWKDHRLRHNLSESLTLIMGTKEPSDIIWVPDTVFIDSVTSNMHHVTVNNHKIDINPDGSVFWGTRVTVSPSCPLDLKSYPMDRQTCSFEILSYAYTSRHIKYRWLNNPGMKVLPLLMAQFTLQSYTTTEKEEVYVAGSYTVLKGHFHFKRLMGFAVMQIYIPTTCVVIVSWISLWVKRAAVPARIALLITTLLTISTVWSSVNAQLPRVNYVKAIDIFMMISFGSVIFSLLEFTVVLNTDVILRLFNRKKRKREQKPLPPPSLPPPSYSTATVGSNGSNGLNHDSTSFTYDGKNALVEINDDNTKLYKALHLVNENRIHDAGASETKNESLSKEELNEASELLADRIENGARVIFPLVYIVFLISYFPYYLSID